MVLSKSLLLLAKWHHAAFWSIKLIRAEKNYGTHDQEL